MTASALLSPPEESAMPIKDVFLPLVGEPSAAAIAAIDKCVAVSGDFGAKVNAVAIEEDIPVRPQVISSDLDNSAPPRGAGAGALAIRQSAETVRIITATDKRTPEEMRSGTALVDHLAEHGISAVFEAVKIDGSSIGKVFEAYVKKNAVALLVM